MEHLFKKIDTQGITYLETLSGSREWYWGTDYIHGDLYEAEELFRDGHPVNRNKLLFVHDPDGTVVQPVIAQKGQYLGRPICYEGRIAILMVDFPAGQIIVIQFDGALENMIERTEIPLSAVKNCYNLMLETAPLMVTRQGNEDTFQILWPEQVSFEIGERESFWIRHGDKLYFSTWQEEPEYREEIIVRKLETGEIIDRFPGVSMTMPDGRLWVLT
mgnify:CR=1 FL=1